MLLPTNGCSLELCIPFLKLTNRSFSLSRHKKINSKPFNEKSKKYKNVVEGQYINRPLQVLRLCDTSFLSYLPKRGTQLYMVLYGINTVKLQLWSFTCTRCNVPITSFQHLTFTASDSAEIESSFY